MTDATASEPGMIVRSGTPYNAEPTLARLRAAPVTAQADFYVRNHGDVPRLREASHRLRVAGRVRATLDLSMADLRANFPQRSVTAVLQCAGNRRADMQAVRPTSGTPWGAGAIGNATWTGAVLADVLRAAGADTDAALHVAFTACDEIELPAEGRFTFGVSIPMTKAMAPEVLLATAMNGQALAPEHGFPLRLVVPGFAGVRSPKWLAAITVQDTPSANPMQQRDYRLLPAHVTAQTVDWAKGMTIEGMPLNAAICEPAAGAELEAGATMVRGYAVAAAREVRRVDVSIDGGRSWTQAELEPGTGTPWSWRFWSATVDLPAGGHELVVRAWDSAGQTQPALADDVWNFKGYLCAAWHRVRVSAR